MNSNEIRELAANGLWDGGPVGGRVLETHISWVILTANFAFKIKKPLRFSFLDFSTLERRRHYCQREVELNRRLTDIYLDVVPIHRRDVGLVLGGGGAAPLDYAVRMRKMDPALEMSRMLAKGRVSPPAIEALADMLAGFHATATVVHRPFEEQEMKQNFNDLHSVVGSVGRRLGADYARICTSAIDYSNRLLPQHRALLGNRTANGFRRDLHGDFHTSNVFLSMPPVIFDCIEFNDTMREIDILDEVAFLCMDLEARGHYDLSEQFVRAYTRRMELRWSDAKRVLFTYFKIYRAGVRAKVTALRNGDGRTWREVARYLDYMRAQLVQADAAPAIHE